MNDIQDFGCYQMSFIIKYALKYIYTYTFIRMYTLEPDRKCGMRGNNFKIFNAMDNAASQV